MYRICIIGGTGAFGQFWKEYFEAKGMEVMITGRSTPLTPREAVQRADIIIFSVSIRAVASAIDELIPSLPPDRLVMDFTGIKQEASRHLRQYRNGEVVATHPMFGPWTLSLSGQNIAYDPIRPGEKWQFIENMWRADGANMIELSSERHDELVAIVQSSVHIMNLVLGHILEKRGIRVDELLRIATPNSRMQVCILGRFLNQKASLYTDMQMYNTRYRDEILPEMLDYFHTLHDMVQRGDTDGFESEFDAIKETVGESFLGFARSISESFDANIKRAFHERELSSEEKRGSEGG